MQGFLLHAEPRNQVHDIFLLCKGSQKKLDEQHLPQKGERERKIVASPVFLLSAIVEVGLVIMDTELQFLTNIFNKYWTFFMVRHCMRHQTHSNEENNRNLCFSLINIFGRTKRQYTNKDNVYYVTIGEESRRKRTQTLHFLFLSDEECHR